jgi:exodeoxyribonuclease VII large subunit
VLFRGNAQHVTTPLADGVQVEALGDLSVFEARGSMQLNVRRIQGSGRGALQAAFEALKAKLAAEGLFDASLKKPIPKFPTTIGVITSPTGAALQDMLNIISRRSPWLRVLVFPVRVQGDGAAAEIVQALKFFTQPPADFPLVDTVVLARGGGSYEDLWSFNEEAVARAMAACPLPLISAVGHEIDFTIADFVADLRAPTPSAAAELLAPDGGELVNRLQQSENMLQTRLQQHLRQREQLLRLLESGALHRVPERILAEARQLLDTVAAELPVAMESRLAAAERGLSEAALHLKALRPDAQLAARQKLLETYGDRIQTRIGHYLKNRQDAVKHRGDLLRSIGPAAVLSRGYSHTSNAKGKTIRSVRDIGPGEQMVTHLADGTVVSVVQPTS